MYLKILLAGDHDDLVHVGDHDARLEQQRQVQHHVLVPACGTFHSLKMGDYLVFLLFLLYALYYSNGIRTSRVSRKTNKSKIVESQKFFVDIQRSWATKKSFRSLASSDLLDQDTYILRKMGKIHDFSHLLTDICSIAYYPLLSNILA